MARLITSCWNRRVMAVRAVAHEGRTIWPSVAGCNGNPRAEVDESTTQVAVHVRGGTTNNDCCEIVCVRLEEPLGERAVLDVTTREPVPVVNTGDVFGECP